MKESTPQPKAGAKPEGKPQGVNPAKVVKESLAASRAKAAAAQAQPEAAGAAPEAGGDPKAEIERRIKAAEAAFAAGKIPEAAKLYAVLARAFGGTAKFHANLGVCMRRLGRPLAAIASYRRALALAPDEASIHSSLGNALRDIGRLDEAVAAQRRAFELAPRDRNVRYNLALVLRDMREHKEALQLLRALAAEVPENAEYAWDFALTQLQSGDFRAGFRGYEARWKLPRNGTPLREGLQWDGGALAGKSIFLQSEQGFGDAIQFVRFAPRLAQRGARVVLECLPELQRLFAGVEGVAQTVVKGGEAPAADVSAPLLSLPRLFNTTMGELPGTIPYLRPVSALGLPPLAMQGALRVGLVWAGSIRPHNRSWPLALLAPLFDDPRVAFVSLQKGPPAGELARTGFDHVVHNLGPKLDDFADTAAAMEKLDLVISVDTAAAHLAGALGKPVWVLLRYAADWRWFDGRADSPWYPTMRLFRQEKPDDFEGPVQAVRAELSRMVAAKP